MIKRRKDRPAPDPNAKRNREPEPYFIFGKPRGPYGRDVPPGFAEGIRKAMTGE